MGLGALCISFVDKFELSHFTTRKVAQIHDWRLAIVYWGMVFSAVGYLFRSLNESQSYLVTTTPTGSTSHWATHDYPSDLKFNRNGPCHEACGSVANYYEGLELMKLWTSANDGSFSYCNTSEYNFVWSNSWTYGPFQCAFEHHSRTWKKSKDVLYFTTAVETTASRCISAPLGIANASGCNSTFAAAGLVCPRGAQYFAGTCCCSRVEFLFNAAIEHLTIEFDHYYDSLFGRDLASGRGGQPRTIFRRADCVETSPESCNVLELAAGGHVTIPLGHLLSMVRVDLDSDGCRQSAGGESLRRGGACPRPRLTGLVIELKLSYYNYDLHRGGIIFQDKEPLCIVDMIPKIRWNSQGHDVAVNREPKWAEGRPGLINPEETFNTYRYGISVNFVAGGKIGRWDFFALMNAILQTVVLIGTAKSITTFIAKNAMGESSKIYKGAIKEKLSVPRELARFACQSLVFCEILKGMDPDGSGSVSQDALRSVLKKSPLMQDMKDEQLETCVRDVMDLLTHAHKKMASVDPDPGSDSINLSDLVQFMTDDRISSTFWKERLASTPANQNRRFSFTRGWLTDSHPLSHDTSG